jgi:hypothetical protein
MEAIGNFTGLLFPVELVSQWSHHYATMPLFPFFSTVHYILTACALRKEPGKAIEIHLMHASNWIKKYL